MDGEYIFVIEAYNTLASLGQVNNRRRTDVVTLEIRASTETEAIERAKKVAIREGYIAVDTINTTYLGQRK